MKEPGKFDLVYRNENGAEVVEYAVTQEKRVGVLLFSGLLGRPLAWLAAAGLDGGTALPALPHSVREAPGLGRLQTPPPCLLTVTTASQGLL